MTIEIFENPMATRQQLSGDPHRPNYHFLPPRNWMNDPNGLFYWQGRYHLFYQFNPYHPLWGFIHWGHASSVDLIHWEDHPMALIPEKGLGDENGCWSGCLVDDGGVPTAVYTGFVNPTTTPVLCAHTHDPMLIEWKKSQHNPVIAEAPAGVKKTDFRDPYVWREDEIWKMVIGAGMEDGDCAVLLYESPDLRTWDYQGLLLKGKTLDSVSMWECPNFFKFDDRYVLLVSLFPDIQGVYYYAGEFDGRNFTPQTEGFLEDGPIFYAPHVRQFEDGRTILFGWLLESRSETAIKAAGWAGVQSLPRELSLDERGRLVSKPMAAFTEMREAAVSMQNICLNQGERQEGYARGKCLEIEAVVERGEGTFVLGVFVSPNGTEETRIICDPVENKVTLDTSESSLSKKVSVGKRSVTIPDTFLEVIKIHVFLDRSVIEVWINDSVSISGRVYPTLRESDCLYLLSEKAKTQVRSLDIWSVKAIWPINQEAERRSLK